MLEDLEAALRAKWDRDTLAVYADHLQSLGELRGELIVIDLRIEEDGPLPELVARRKELLAAWLATLPPGKVQHGFLDVDATGANPVEQVRAALASPAAPYIRTVAIVGAPKTIREAITILASAPRPGLARIVLRQWDAGTSPTLDAQLTRQVFAATPDLDTLELDGHLVCADASHPTLRRARISGSDAIRSLLDHSAATWPALEELDFAFASHIGGRSGRYEHDLLPQHNLPVLHTLDLSRNEPGFLDPINLGADVDVIGVFTGLRVIRQLRHVRLPGVRRQSLPALRQALPAMTQLEDLAIRGPVRHLDHPTARISFF